MLYFDANALAKRYVREKGSLEVRRLLASDVPGTSRYSVVELSRRHWRGGRGKEPSPPRTANAPWRR
jgi:predicted nucleic acid-binding protein